MSGRPGTEKRKQTVIIQCRVDPADKATIAARAKAAGMSVSQMVRSALLGYRAPRPKVDVQAIARLLAELGTLRGEFGKIGSNINQIAYRYNISEGRPTGNIEGALLAALAEFERGVATFDELRLINLQAVGKEPDRKPPKR